MSQCCKAVSLPRHIKQFLIFIHLVVLAAFSFDVNAEHVLTTHSLDFGGVGLNQASTQNLGLTLSIQTYESLIQSIDTTGDFYISYHNCPFNDPTPTTCTISVLFNPQSVGSITGNLIIAGLDRQSGTESPFTETVQLTGIGLFSELSFNTNNGLDFGTVEVNTVSAPMQVVLSNTGNGPIDLTNIAIAAGFNQTNDCPASLPADSSCTFSIRAAPSNEITYSGSLQVNGTAPQADVVTGINLLVEGVGSELTVSPTSLRLADTPVGTISDTRQITVSNRGTEPLYNLSMSLTAPFNLNHDCPTTLNPTDWCSVSVNATPTTAGDFSTSLVIQGSTAAGGTKNQSVGLGVHALQGALSVSQSGLIFADTPVGSDAQPQVLTLTNQGDAILSLESFSIDAPFTQTNDCAAQLPVGESCDVTILFSPLAAGTLQGNLTIDTDAGSSSVTLAGVATDSSSVDDPVVPLPAGSILTTSTTALLFPDTAVNRTSVPQSFSVTNEGDTSATLNSITLDAEFTQTSNCIGTLAAGAQCEVSVIFNPSASGTVSGTLSLDTSQGTITVSLSGTALAATRATLPVISDPDEIAELLDPYVGEDPNVAATGDAIAAGCASGRVSERMQQDCNTLIVAASDGNSGTANALRMITPDASGKANNLSRLGGKAQVRNLGARISALRMGARGLSLNGLNWNIDGESLPLATLMNVYQATPRTGGSAGDDGDLYDDRLGVFITGSISSGSKDDTALESGLDFDTQGITLGSDYRITDRFILGGALGYVGTRSDLSNDGGDVDTRGYSLNLYGTYFIASEFFVDFATGYAQNRFDQERRVIYQLDDSVHVNQTFSADYDGDSYSLFIGSGYDLNRNTWSFGPRLDIEYIRSDVDSFQEQSRSTDTEGSGWATRVEEMQQTWLTLNLGGRVAYTHSTDWGVMIPYLRLDWLHEFKDDSQTLTAYFVDDPDAQAIEIVTDEPDRDYMRLRLGTSAQFQNGLVGFIDYGQIFARENWNSWDFSVGIRMGF